MTTALRRQGHLDRVLAYLLERGVPKKSGDFEATLRISLAQILYLPELGDHSALFLAGEAMKADTRTQHLASLTNAVLRRAQREAEQLREAPLELLFPKRLVSKWTKAYGADAIEIFAAALLEGAPLDLTLRDDGADLIEALGATPILADSVRVGERDKPVDQMPGYAEGRFWVQDVAASIPARLMDVPKGGHVLDMCAAPGGKTAQLIKAGYWVSALDNDPARVVRLHANLTRLDYRAELLTADGLTYSTDEPFDGVLLDAPCSATGTFRRHPEVIWHRDASDIAGRVALQRGFIERAALLLKPGGTLIYCVCSLEPEEGEQQADWIAKSGLGARAVADHSGGAFGMGRARDGRGGMCVPIRG